MTEGKTFYDVALDDVPELIVAEEGEYRVQVTDAEISTSDKTGGQYILLRLEIPSIPNSKDFTDVIMFPTESDTEKQRIRRLNRLRDTLHALDYNERGPDGRTHLDPELIVGSQGWAYLTIEESADYGHQNRVRKWIKEQ